MTRPNGDDATNVAEQGVRLTDAELDELGQRAGASLRRPPPPEGHLLAKRSARNRQMLRTGVGLAALGLVGGAVVMVSWPTDDDVVAPSETAPPTTSVTTTSTTPATAPVTPPGDPSPSAGAPSRDDTAVRLDVVAGPSAAAYGAVVAFAGDDSITTGCNRPWESGRPCREWRSVAVDGRVLGAPVSHPCPLVEVDGGIGVDLPELVAYMIGWADSAWRRSLQPQSPCLQVGPSGDVAVAEVGDGTTAVLDLATGSTIAILRGQHASVAGDTEIATWSIGSPLTFHQVDALRAGVDESRSTSTAGMLLAGSTRRDLVAYLAEGSVIVESVSVHAERLRMPIAGSTEDVISISVSISHDSETIAVLRTLADGRATVTTYDIDSGHQRWSTPVQVGGTPSDQFVLPADLIYSPDGLMIATIGTDGGAQLLDAATGVELADLDDLSTCTDTVFSIAFDPNGRRLAVGGPECVQLMWYDVTTDGTSAQAATPAFDASDRISLQPEREIAAEAFGELVFSGDGTSLATGCAFNPELQCEQFTSMAVDGSTLPQQLPCPASLVDGRLVWDVAASGAAAAFTATADTAWAGTDSGCLTVDPTGRFAAAGTPLSDVNDTTSTTTSLFDAIDGHVIAEVDGGWSRAFSPDGRYLAVGGPNGLSLVDTATGSSEEWAPAADPTSSPIVSDLRFSPDGRFLTGRADVALIWSVPELRVVHRFGPGVVSVDIGPSGAIAVLEGGGWVSDVSVLDGDTFDVLWRYELHAGLDAEFWSLGYGAGGTMVMTIGTNGAGYLLDASDGGVLAELGDLSACIGTVRAIATSPVEPVLAIGGDCVQLVRYELRSG